MKAICRAVDYDLLLDRLFRRIDGLGMRDDIDNATMVAEVEDFFGSDIGQRYRNWLLDGGEEVDGD